MPCSPNLEDIDKSGKDTGYQIREKFYYMKYLSFKQDYPKKELFLDNELFKKNFEYYFFQDEIVAVHFNKTSRNIKSTLLKNLLWNFLRAKNARTCYKIVKDSP